MHQAKVVIETTNKAHFTLSLNLKVFEDNTKVFEGILIFLEERPLQRKKMNWDSTLLKRSGFRRAVVETQISPFNEAMIRAHEEQKEMERHQKSLEREKDIQNFNLFKEEMACLARKKRAEAIAVNDYNHEMVMEKQETDRRSKESDRIYRQHLFKLHEEYREELRAEKERERMQKRSLLEDRLDEIEERREQKKIQARLNELSDLKVAEVSKQKQQLNDDWEREKKERRNNRIRYLESLGKITADEVKRKAQERDRRENERISRQNQEDLTRQLQSEMELREKQRSAAMSANRYNISEIERHAEEREIKRQLSYQETRRLLRESEEHVQLLKQQKRKRMEEQKLINEHNFALFSQKRVEEKRIKEQNKAFTEQTERDLQLEKKLLFDRRMGLLQSQRPDDQMTPDPANERTWVNDEEHLRRPKIWGGSFHGKKTKETTFINMCQKGLNPLPLKIPFPGNSHRKLTQDKTHVQSFFENTLRNTEDNFPRPKNRIVLANQTTHTTHQETLRLPVLNNSMTRNVGQPFATYGGKPLNFYPKPPSRPRDL